MCIVFVIYVLLGCGSIGFNFFFFGFNVFLFGVMCMSGSEWVYLGISNSSSS